MIRSILAIVAVVPGIAFAQAEPAADPNLRSLSIEQLCDMRESRAARAELERRDVFSQRELRAIVKERVRPGIGPKAVSCFMGEPVDVFTAPSVNLATAFGGRVFEAYVYAIDAMQTLVVYVEHDGNEPTVIDQVRMDERPTYEDLLPVSCVADACRVGQVTPSSPRDSFKGGPGLFGPFGPE
jgi:hypothetical protein